jgi:hypothetical protein
MYQVSKTRPFGMLDDGSSPKLECIKINLNHKRELLYVFYVVFSVYNVSFVVCVALCAVFIVCNVSFVVCVALCALFIVCNVSSTVCVALCALFIVCNVSFTVYVALCAVFSSSMVYYFV